MGSVVNIGVDLATISRIQLVLMKHPERFPLRILSEPERLEFEGLKARLKDSEGGQRALADFLAKAFSAKEAVMKALGTGLSQGIIWRDIQLGHLPSGQPRIALTGKAHARALSLGISHWHVSLTDEKDTVCAVVVASS